MPTELEKIEAAIARKEKPGTKRTLGGEIARSAVTGPAGILDIFPLIGNLPTYGINAVSKLVGSEKRAEPPFYYPSELVREQLEKASGVQGEPKTLGQQALGTATEFATGGGALGQLSKLSKAKNFLTQGNPEKIKDYITLAGGGAGAGALENQFPDLPGAGLIGAIAGGKATQAATSPNKALETVTSPYQTLARKNILENVEPEAIAKKQAAAEIGVHLTPAEASGNPLAGAQQGRLGTTSQGAKDLHKFHTERMKQENNAINGLLSDVNVKDQIVSSEVRNVANDIIGKYEQELIQKAKPYYDKSAPKTIPQKAFSRLFSEDPTIGNAVESVLSDSKYAVEIKGYAPNSIKILDLAKKRIDAAIELAKRNGDKDAVRVLNNSKKSLVENLDKISPDYKKARAIYTEDSPAIEAIRNSDIGKIAKTNDRDLHKISQDIFSSAKTDLDAFKKVRDEIYQESPEAWMGITRNEMARRINDSEVTGSAFHKKILANERGYKQFEAALEKSPKAKAKLRIMRDTFGDLIGERSVKTAAGQSKISVDMPRNLAEVGKRVLDKLTGGRYDKAAIALITSDNWDKELLKIAGDRDKKFKAVKMLSLLNTVEGEGSKEEAESPEMTELEKIEAAIARREQRQ